MACDSLTEQSQYIMTERIYSHRITRNVSMICRKCSVEIKINDKVLTKPAGNSKTKIYHIKCAKKIGII